MRKAVIGLAALLLVGGALLHVRRAMESRGKGDGFMTETVSRGPVALEVMSTGAIKSVVTVQVGTQVSGTIQQLLADHNTKVKEGQVIAKLDPALFEANLEREAANVASAEASLLKQRAAVAQAKRTLDTADNLYNAQVAQAQSNLAVAKANLEKAKAVQTQTKRSLDRATQLVSQKTISQSDHDDAEANHEAAEAQLKAAEAQVEAAQANLQLTQVQSGNVRGDARTEYDTALAQVKIMEAQLAQAKAAHKLAKVNYEHTIITSPIDGIVVARQVDVGQTVAASFQSPTLFTIANDLTKMQVEATVDEADIGRIKVGQRATFTVDSFPDDEVEGKVAQVRLSPTTVQNVVTYTVIVSADNAESKLLPGMTAEMTFHVARRESALRVPNTAVRYQPPDDLMEPGAQEEIREQSEGPGKDGAAHEGPKKGEKRMAHVWVTAEGGRLRPVRFRPGLTDSKYTEVVEGEIKEGQEVVIGLMESQAPGRSGPLSGVRRF